MGIKDPKKKYQIEDMVRGDCLFAATGVTTGGKDHAVCVRLPCILRVRQPGKADWTH